MILISSEMFEKFTRWAQARAEEDFRRFVFDNPMPPEVVELVRDQVVEAMVELRMERVGERAAEFLARRRNRIDQQQDRVKDAAIIAKIEQPNRKKRIRSVGKPRRRLSRREEAR